MDTDRVTVYVKTEALYGDITKDNEVRFDTSSY